MGAGCFKTIEFRQRRRCTAFGAHPCKQNTAALLDGVIALLDACAQNAAFGLGRCFEALACDVKFPTVERATKAIAFIAAKGQVGPAVRTVAV